MFKCIFQAWIYKKSVFSWPAVKYHTATSSFTSPEARIACLLVWPTDRLGRISESYLMPAALYLLWQILEETSLVVLPTPLFLTDIRAFLGLFRSCLIFCLPPLYPVHRSRLVEAFLFVTRPKLPQETSCAQSTRCAGTSLYCVVHTLSYFLVLYDTFWSFLGLFGTLCYFLVLYDTFWSCLELFGTLCYFLVLHDAFWDLVHFVQSRRRHP